MVWFCWQGDRYRSSSLKLMKSLLYLLLTVILLVSETSASDITGAVFGKDTDYLPAAFGDFNSDEYTDLFVLRDMAQTLEILLGQDVEPFLRPAGLRCKFQNKITSVVPGDFDGDALMDVMVTLGQPNGKYNVHIIWGGLNYLNCSHEEKPIITVTGQPLAIDCDQNMIIDLFGVDENEERTIWIFNNNRTTPTALRMAKETNNAAIKIPHSNAFLDLDKDSFADLYITTDKNFEIWSGTNICFFHPQKEIEFPPGVKSSNQLGQTVFQDFELEGKIDHLVPVCFNEDCSNSTLYIYSSNKWHNLKLNMHDGSNAWSFVSPSSVLPYINTITLRPGDFNMDGYPDLLATLKLGDQYKSFFLENIECTSNCDGYARTFAVRWNALSPYNNETLLGVFYDFMQDGILDVIFVHYNKYPNVYNVSAFQNSLDYDANFVKVMVVTGLTNKEQPLTIGPLGKKRRTYGTNLPGPRVSYQTTTQEGKPRAGAAVQIPQSAHFSLHLPYTIFGLGRTPNFVDSLTVGVYGNHRVWTQLIPNSQMVIIPWPTDDPSQWRVQLFVTPSKLIFQSIVALLGTCVLILIIIGVLYWKERREDHFEKLQEAHKFHFDAM